MKFSLVVLIAISVIAAGGIPVFAETAISDKVVVLHTKSGDMVIELFPEDAPKTVANFLNLTEHGFYDRTVFHRVIKDFMIQGGDPKTKPQAYKDVSEWGTGDAGYTIPGEFNTIKHKRGIVSMARSSDPDSGSSQFFIVHKDSFDLDQNYAAFGRLATDTSYETLDKIANLETAGETANNIPLKWGEAEVLSAEIKNRSEILDLLDPGEPERIPTLTNQTAQEYSNEKLGFSFVPPLGWFVQEPPKRSPQTPDVVAVGSKIGGFTPAISFSVKNSNGTSLESYSASIKKTLQKAIDDGKLTILMEEKTSINGNEAYITDAVGKFATPEGTINVKFQEIIIKNSEMFYVITYSNSENNFDATLPKFIETVDSFKITSSPNGGCLIATATYGSELAPQVQLLREIRDGTVLNTNSGSAFMIGFNQFYYSFSPIIADWERQNPTFKELVKITITPMLSTMSILNYVDIDSEQELLGYGVGVILLNMGMYFVVPAIIIVKTKNRLQRFTAKI
ncbi:MAG TPA: peptidylprolyl isomerase [Nitrosopumilaceae archaeon]|nr:peptidylprolyl isomerase [Nitrosopumilaceae archaeon]